MRRRRAILIVEDDAAIARALADLLASDGYRALVAGDGEKGLAIVTARKPDLVLLDVNLPRLSGLEVCRQARLRGYRGPVLMLSARTEPIDRVSGLEAGADDYVTKPFFPHELLARVRAHLRTVERVKTGVPAERPRRTSTVPGHTLRVVMFTDMKDFSKRMNEDEGTALTLLRRHNRILKTHFTRFGGTVIEVIGDAFLVCFTNALKAVNCAAAIQRHLLRANKGRSAREQIRVRIGIHLGDIIEEEGRVRGDAVNIAARLQQIASPESIAVSEAVYTVVEGRIRIRARRLGVRKVKNIRQPVTVYRLSPLSQSPGVPHEMRSHY